MQVGEYRLPESYDSLIEEQLNQLGHFNLNRPSTLAQPIMELSNWYHRSENESVNQTVDLWTNNAFCAAYLAYYFPLNYMRARFVFEKVLPHINITSESTIFDFGSGCGAASLALSDLLNDHFPDVECKIDFFDQSEKALQLHEDFLTLPQHRKHNWTRLKKSEAAKGKYQITLLSYVLNEMSDSTQITQNSETQIFMEPSTQTAARRLMEMRNQFITNGLNILAPCTHNQACPLLSFSEKDWCHMRLPVQLPPWFDGLQKLLPMKNQTLTVSYLASSKQKSSLELTPSLRVLGATQKEKGKTKQLVCRSDQREFLSWLKKNKHEQFLPSGQRVAEPDSIEVKGNELRVAKDLELLKG
jgi:ribosomal protein RSM22 (predicted rRNA methylase)